MPETWTEQEKLEALAEYDAWLDMVRAIAWAEDEGEIEALHLVGDR